MLTKTSPGRKEFISAYISPWQFTTDGSQRRNLSRNHGREAVWWLALRSVISLCSYTVQTQPRDGNTLSGLDSPTSLSNQKKCAPRQVHTANYGLSRQLFSWGAPFPGVYLTAEISQPNRALRSGKERGRWVKWGLGVQSSARWDNESCFRSTDKMF